ncbi:MAG: ROK family protein [Rhizobiaceae bacterium]|jgi:glucokinase|nr:ROK family protein [Rhizobiaceae bacterium]
MAHTLGNLALGIDVGGTKTALGVVDVQTGVIHARASLATPQPFAGTDFLAEIVAAALALDPTCALPVGLGLCELVTRDGVIASGWRVRWQTGDVRAAFARWPSFALEADVRAAARAEAMFGAGRGHAHWIYANAGTGIACCLMADGAPHLGVSGLGMAWGMSPADLTSKAGSQTIEDCSGGAALLAKAKSVGLPVSSVGELSALADGGDAEANTILTEGGTVLGHGLGALANMLDPQVIILGGGLGMASAAYRRAVEAGIDACLWPAARPRPPLIPARCGSDAGLIGAALIA